MKLYVLLFILSSIMTQCGPPPTDPASSDKPLVVDGKSTGMYRFYDPEYGVACYQRASHFPLSCVKVK